MLSLNNVRLSVFEWSIYVTISSRFYTTITNSLVNELAAPPGGLVNFSGVVLQYAELVAFGPGAVLNVFSGAQIWSQGIQAQSGGKANVAGSTLPRNEIFATGAGSVVTISATADAQNGSRLSCAGNSPPNANGVPLCNPQNPLKQCSQVIAQNGGIVTGLPACP